MPEALSRDGYRLYYEDTGTGVPIVLIHEFAGNHASWEPQVRAFSRRYRVIVGAARGYPPSAVPDDFDAYSQNHAVNDVIDIMDAAGIEQAHIVGLSMGGFTTLHLGLNYPQRARSLTIAGAGYGAFRAEQAVFIQASRAAAEQFLTLGSKQYAPIYATAPARIPFQIKDPRGWQEFADALGQHSALGSALTLLGVQARRPALDDLTDQLATMNQPTLIIAGDEDDHALQPAIFLKRWLPASGLLVLPKTGHTINLEEPDRFNRAVLDFIATVDAGRWSSRDSRSTGAILKTS
jgi:pimeloyl-ACP methyl ester carboxylesterase